jgi:hypothetical protein
VLIVQRKTRDTTVFQESADIRWWTPSSGIAKDVEVTRAEAMSDTRMCPGNANGLEQRYVMADVPASIRETREYRWQMNYCW